MTTGGGAAGARAEAMARRLDRTARRLGIGTDDRARLQDAFRAAMQPRMAGIQGDHHPDYLHPARTALILMDDCRVDDPDVIVAAIFAESRSQAPAVDPTAARRIAPEAAAMAAAIPGHPRQDDRLIELLLALPTGSAMVAAAERLDHARHLHLRDPGEWRPYHGVTCSAYAPIAARTHPRLGERLEWWCSVFERRFLDA